MSLPYSAFTHRRLARRRAARPRGGFRRCGRVPTASTYMNFVYDPGIAAQLALGANFISSVTGLEAEATKLNPDAAENTLVFPTEEMLGQMHQNDPAMFSNPEYTKRWLAVQGK